MRKLLILAGALILTSSGFAALDGPVNAFSSGSTNLASTLSYAIVTARSGNNGAPAVKYINAGSSSNAPTVYFYKVTARATATHTNSTVTLFVDSTNGFATNNVVIVIRHLRDDTYEKRLTTVNSASTNIVTTVTADGVVEPGDIIYATTKTGVGRISWPAASTNSLSGSGAPLFIGQAGYPLLTEIDSITTSGSLYLISGDFLEPPRVPRPGL